MSARRTQSTHKTVTRTSTCRVPHIRKHNARVAFKASPSVLAPSPILFLLMSNFLDDDVRLVTIYLQRAAHKSSCTLAVEMLVTFPHRRCSKVTDDRRCLTFHSLEKKQVTFMTMPTEKSPTHVDGDVDFVQTRMTHVSRVAEHHFRKKCAQCARTRKPSSQ